MKKLSLVAAAGALALAACREPQRPAEPERLPRLTVHAVKARAEVQGLQAPATVAPVQRATVSSRVPARVKRLLVREGDVVKAGALVATLADDDLRAQLAAAKAALASATAHARRVTTLSAESAATKSELESAQAQRAQAQAAVGAAEEALRYTELRAPFDGRIQAKHVTEGDLVTPGAPLLEVEGAALELVATLSGEEVGRVQRGQSVEFQAGERRGKAEVTSIAPSADPVSHRVEVRARIAEVPPGLRAGEFARVVLPGVSAGPAEVWIPSAAVVQRGDLRGVFVANGERAELRWLQMGDAVNGAVPVRAGLRGNEVLIEAPEGLKDGQPIEVARAD